MVKRIVSGGQTGVDRAALDVALERGIPCGGWCPKGRRAEDGRIPERYPLKETPSPRYPERTEWNVRDSDGTLVLAAREPERGTALTIAMARKWRKPCRVADLGDLPEVAGVLAWLRAERIGTLHVAGPRESTSPGAYDLAAPFLRELLALARR